MWLADLYLSHSNVTCQKKKRLCQKKKNKTQFNTLNMYCYSRFGQTEKLNPIQKKQTNKQTKHFWSQREKYNTKFFFFLSMHLFHLYGNLLRDKMRILPSLDHVWLQWKFFCIRYKSYKKIWIHQKLWCSRNQLCPTHLHTTISTLQTH